MIITQVYTGNYKHFIIIIIILVIIIIFFKTSHSIITIKIKLYTSPLIGSVKLAV